MKRIRFFKAVLLAIASLMSTDAIAQSPDAAFYAGKQITIFPGYSSGGSSSLYAQSLARHMGRYIPGNPTIIVQNMPGAGGLLVANYMNASAAKDGTAFAITSRAAVMEPLLGNDNARFDPRQFGWIGNATEESSVCVSWHTSPVKTADDLFKAELVAGGSGSESMEVLIPKATNKLLGTKINVVMGYPGSTEIILAMERDEVRGFCGLSWSLLTLRRADLLRDKKVNVLFQIGLKPVPAMGDVPLIQSFAKSPEDRAILEFLSAPQELGRAFFTPPGVPADRLQTLRDAFMATMKDPVFLEEAKKQGLEIDPVLGEDVQKLVERVYATPKELVDKAKEASRATASK